MLVIKRVLYATDFSETSGQAFPYALRLAALHGADLRMVHVIGRYGADPTDPACHYPEPERIDEQLWTYAKQRMASLAEGTVAARVPISHVDLRDMAPAPAILGYAEEKDVDLIVLGTHGRRGLRHFFLGSVAEEVLRLARCPVLVVPATDEPQEVVRLERIAVPIDYSRHSDAALAVAREIAREEGAALMLMHVLEAVQKAYPDFYFPATPLEPIDLPGLETEAKRRLQERRTRIVGSGVRTDISVRHGHPVEGIITFAEQERVDLIVISSHGHTGLRHLLLGSVAGRIARRAPCPVLVIKAFGKGLLDGKP